MISRALSQSISQPIAHSAGRELPLLEQLQLAFAGYEWATYKNDPATMYTAIDGVRVSAAADPLGLWIDQSQGGEGNSGPELVANGTFDSNIDGWDEFFGTITWSSGKLRVTEDADGIGARARQLLTTVSGQWYKVVIGETVKGAGSSSTIIAVVDGGTAAYGTNIAQSAINGNATDATLFFRAQSSTTSLIIASGNAADGDWFEIDNVSVREVPGHHASQVTAPGRPEWDGENVAFDGSDDALITSFLMDSAAASLFVLASSETNGGIIAGAYNSVAGSNRIYVSRNSGNFAGGFGDVNPSDLFSSQSADTLKIAGVRGDASAADYIVGGEVVDTGVTTEGADSGSALAIGALGRSSGVQSVSKAKIKAVLAVKKKITDPELALVTAYLNSLRTAP